MQIETYLYDARGNDQRVKLDTEIYRNLNDEQLLWVNVLERDEETLRYVAGLLELKDFPVRSTMNVLERPKIDRFENFYHAFIVSVRLTDDGKIFQIPIDLIAGENFIITIHDGRIEYFQEFLEREKGETALGELDAESFVATLLDLHIVTYFRALEEIETEVDKLDSLILRRELRDQEFLRKMVVLRGNVSKLRRWFLPHRDVFYSLSRPDFRPIAESDSAAHYQMLNQHFETCVDAIDSSRDSVISLFELYTTKTSYQMNKLIRSLTLITLVVGTMGAIAGVFGMNFEVGYFKSAETGFWLTITVMAFIALGAIILARFKNWI